MVDKNNQDMYSLLSLLSCYSDQWNLTFNQRTESMNANTLRERELRLNLQRLVWELKIASSENFPWWWCGGLSENYILSLSNFYQTDQNWLVKSKFVQFLVFKIHLPYTCNSWLNVHLTQFINSKKSISGRSIVSSKPPFCWWWILKCHSWHHFSTG